MYNEQPFGMTMLMARQIPVRMSVPAWQVLRPRTLIQQKITSLAGTSIAAKMKCVR